MVRHPAPIQEFPWPVRMSTSSSGRYIAPDPFSQEARSLLVGITWTVVNNALCQLQYLVLDFVGQAID